MKLIKDLGVIKFPENGKTRCRVGIYECPDCNSHIKVRTAHVKAGNTKKCRSCSTKKHGQYGTRLYNIWDQMKQRCLNSNKPEYGYYGAKGVTVADEWIDFVGFQEWALNSGYTDELTIDRIDSDKGYSPDNCRWADLYTQAANKSIKSNNTSGNTGVYYKEDKEKWESRVGWKNKINILGHFDTKEDAILARDKFIHIYNMPHPIVYQDRFGA